jgi:hypothetical protein
LGKVNQYFSRREEKTLETALIKEFFVSRSSPDIGKMSESSMQLVILLYCIHRIQTVTERQKIDQDLENEHKIFSPDLTHL